MATGRAGTPYARYGAAWGRVAQTAGLNVAFHASDGAVTNILLIERNAAQLGMATTMIGAEARQGQRAVDSGREIRRLPCFVPDVSLGFADRLAAPHRHHHRGAAGRQADRPRRPWRHRHRRRAGDPRRPWPRRPFHHHRHVPERPAADGGRAPRCLRLHQRAAAARHRRRRHQPGTDADRADAGARSTGWSRRSPACAAWCCRPGCFPANACRWPASARQIWRSARRACRTMWRATSPSPPCATAKRWPPSCPPRPPRPQLRPVIEAGLPFHPGAAAALRSLGYDLPARAIER